MSHLEEKCFDGLVCDKPLLYHRFVDDTFAVFTSRDHMLTFFDYVNSLHPSITFTKEEEQSDSLPFLDVLVTRLDDGCLSTSVYRKPTYSGLYMKWDSFVPKQFKRGLVFGLISRAWKLCSNHKIVHDEFCFIKDVLVANGYPVSFIDSCINQFLTRHFSTSQTSEPIFGPIKKRVVISLPFYGPNSTKLKRQLYRFIGAVVPCVELRVVFKPVQKLSTLSKLKSPIDVLCKSNVIYKVQCTDCDSFYVGKTKRVLKQRLDEHKTDDHSAVLRHSRDTGHCIAFEEPSIIASDSDELRLYIKESLKIKELSANKSLNGNIGSMDLHLW